MSDDPSFLDRWSRRKRGAAATKRDQAKPESAGDGAAMPGTAASPVAPNEPQRLIDLSSLPPLDSLGAGSDVRAFLAPGVPADLARAALRRAWSVDPVIRDFIGLSENAWDFNAPGGVPGFGTVTAEEVRRLLAHAIGEPEATDPLRPPAADGASQEQTEQDRLPAAEGAEPNEPTPYDRVDDVAAQQKSGEREHDPISPRRRHGSALPE